jgi:hypothetical protein
VGSAGGQVAESATARQVAADAAAQAAEDAPTVTRIKEQLKIYPSGCAPISGTPGRLDRQAARNGDADPHLFGPTRSPWL